MKRLPYKITECKVTHEWYRLPGYGSLTSKRGSPCASMIRIDKDRRWRRIYAYCVANAASYFVRVDGKEYWLDIADVGRQVPH